MSGMHARDGQARDRLAAIATRIRGWRGRLAAAARDTWTLIRLAWLLLTLISRRAFLRAAGGVTGRAPVAGAPEVPAPAIPPVGAGASPDHLWPGDPEEGPPPRASGAVPRQPWVITWPAPGSPLPVYAVRRDGVITVTSSGTLAVIPAGSVTGDPRDTGRLEALAVPVVTEWAAGRATLARVAAALREHLGRAAS